VTFLTKNGLLSPLRQLVALGRQATQARQQSTSAAVEMVNADRDYSSESPQQQAQPQKMELVSISFAI